MRPRALLFVTIVFLTTLLMTAKTAAIDDFTSVTSETRDAVRQLVGDGIVNGKAYAYGGHLADMIGPRLTGSSNYMRAAEWAEEQFKTLGLTNVHKEEWTIPATWEPEGPATGNIVSPVNHQLHVYSLGWSPSTPKGGLTGDVVYVSNLSPEALDSQKPLVVGKIALVDRSSYGERPAVDKIIAGFEHLRSLSPKAVLFTGGSNGTETLTSLKFTGTISPVPQAQIGLEDSLLIKRLLQRGPVSVQFSVANVIRDNVKIPNVIAEIAGSQRPNEVVLVGAHLDSWQPGTGAQDNGTGVASVMEAARAIEALHRPPRRTIRFVLFGGEEEGLLGSTA